MSKRREIIKTVLLAILLVSLVCLCILYMMSYQGGNSAEFRKEQMNRLDGKSVKYQYMKYRDGDLAFPLFMGISDGERQVGFAGGEEADAFYRHVFRFYEKLFGGEGKRERLSPTEGEALFAEAMGGEYLYLSYLCDLPCSVIVGAGEQDIHGAGGDFLREIFILPTNEGGAYYAVARSLAGQYYRYTTRFVPRSTADAGFHTIWNDAYTAIGKAKPYHFAAEVQDAFFERTDRGAYVTDTTVLLDSPLSGEILRFAPLTFDEAEEKTVLKALFMNPEKISSFTDESGVRSFFDEGESVRFQPNGEVVYTALGASGISLDEIFGYHPDGNDYDTFDSVGAMMLLADRLGIRKKDGLSVSLTGMSYDGRTLILSLGYRYNGIPLFLDGKAEVFRAELSGGILRSLSLHLCDVEGTELFAETEDMDFAMRGYLLDATEKKALIPAYCLGTEAGQYGISIASTTGEVSK